MPPRSIPIRLTTALVPLLLAALSAAATAELPSARPVTVTPSAIPFDTLVITDSPDFANFPLALDRLLGTSAPVNLTGSIDGLDIELPVPGQWKPENVELQLKVMASATLARGSHLRLLVNGSAVAQHPLHDRLAAETLTLTVPAKVLSTGSNRLRLDVVHVPLPGADGSSLWTQVQVADSTITVAASRRRVAPLLSNLGLVFDKASWAERVDVPLFTGEPGNARLQALGLLAQGVGRRLGQVPVVLSHRPLPGNLAALAEAMPEGAIAAVAMGSFDEIAALDLGLDLPTDRGPVLAVSRLPGETDRFVLLVAAASDEDLIPAASAFAIPEAAWPARPWAAIAEARLTPSATGTAANSDYLPLGALGYVTTSFTGDTDDRATLKIWHNGDAGAVRLRLSLDYAANLAADSLVDIRVNGQRASQLLLNNGKGAQREIREITLDGGMWQPGWNTLELTPRLIASQPQEGPRAANRFLTLRDDSLIKAGGWPASGAGDLALISGAGPLPVSPQSDKDDLAFRLAATDHETLAAGLTLAARIAQLHSGSLATSQFGTEDRAAGRQFWVGTWDKLPAPLKQTADGGAMAYDQPAPGNSQLALRLTGRFDSQTTAFAAADDSGRPVMVFAAASPGQLRNGIAALVENRRWQQLQGTVAQWSADGEELRVMGRAVAASVADPTPAGRWSITWLYGLGGALVVALVLVAVRARRDG